MYGVRGGVMMLYSVELASVGEILMSRIYLFNAASMGNMDACEKPL